MKFTYPTTGELEPGDQVWRDGQRITVETIELIEAKEHSQAHYLVNGVPVYLLHVWTRVEG